jgi:AraC-like DNA-binding protein
MSKVNRPPMRFREVRPPEELATIVACFWEFVADAETPPGHIHVIPPDGCTSVSGSPGRVVTFVGPRVEALRMPMQPSSLYFGVRFRPGATRHTLGLTGAQLRDQIGLLSPLNKKFADDMHDAIGKSQTIDQALPGLVAMLDALPKEVDKTVQAGVLAIEVSNGTARIESIADAIGVSERQFQRRFKDEVGLTPKQFARVYRFRAAAIDVAMLGAERWGAVAAERGFSDQPHLVREFAEIFGMTPSDFQTKFAPAIEHVDVGP